jgi:PAS domain S-box-containing protein
VYDGSTPGVATLLVDSDREFAPLPRDYVPTFTATNTMKIAGRTWTLNFHSRPRFDLATESNQPLLIASGGVLVDALLFVIIWQLWVHRTRSATVAQRAVAELRGSEERSRQVVESAPNAMVMVDRDGCIVLVNAQTERMFGYRRTELIGQPMEMLVPARYRVPHPDLRAGFFAAPQSRPMGAGRDLYALRKDGSEFPVEIGLRAYP